MKAKLLQKRALGLDQKGEVVDSNPKGPLNIEDTSTPMSQHKTPLNPVNMIQDNDAEADYPGLGEHEHRFPSRGKL